MASDKRLITYATILISGVIFKIRYFVFINSRVVPIYELIQFITKLKLFAIENDLWNEHMKCNWMQYVYC